MAPAFELDNGERTPAFLLLINPHDFSERVAVQLYQYDARGNRTAVIDPINGAGHPTTFAYDIMNRLTGITYPDGSSVGFGSTIAAAGRQ